MRHWLKTFVVCTLFVGTAHAGSKQTLNPESAAQVVTPENLPTGQLTYKSFAALRLDLLNMIGGAGKRIWIYSDLLADAEIAASLYVAKFRKLEIYVLLDKNRARSPLSRLPTLKNQGVITYLSPKGWRKPAQTAILADERLVYINTELNPYDTKQSNKLHNIGEQDKMAFEANFIKAIGKKIPAIAQQRPLVGRGRQSWRRGEKSAVVSNRPNYNGENDGSFNYNNVKHSRRPPKGISRRLPSKTRMQRKSTAKPTAPETKQEDKTQDRESGGWENP